MGSTLAQELPGAGITGPDDVTAEALAGLPKVGQIRAGRLMSAFIAAQPSYDVVGMLLGAGLPARLAGRCVDLFGPGAPRLLRDDPWRLLQLTGVEVADADAFARAALPGVQPTDSRRSRALVGWVLAQDAQDGHTVCTARQVVEDLALHRVADPEAAIEAAVAAELVRRLDNPLGSMLALVRYAEAETAIAAAVHRLVETAQVIGTVRVTKRRGAAAQIDPDGLDPVQRSAVDNALRHGVSVLTGGPGTGKSRTIAALVRQAERDGKSVALAAPTGRAAKRLAELCDAEAMTIHRLLGVQPRASMAEDGTTPTVDFSAGFARGPEWPLDQELVVVDEASMLDVELAAALLRACADGTHVVIVGDSAQLPSIGPGQVLADLIGSETVPVVELSTLYRQEAGGAIARLATAVRGGQLPGVDSPDREVVIVPARGSAESAHRVVQLMTDSIPRVLGIAPEAIQVVTPVHRGPAGTIALNAALKAVLNPPVGRSFGRFDVGDRVVATANHLEATPTGFANGEVGVVTKVVEKVVTVDFGSGPAEIAGKMLADVSHGWAITVHRAQGSEFPAVIVVLPPEAGRLMSRPLVYTALTRAQRHLSIVHGAGAAVVRAVHDVGGKPRRTALRDHL